jgi:hypothetical protein
MPPVFVFEKEKLKPLLKLYIETGANFEEKFPSQYKRPIRMIMNENIPMVHISDGYYHIDAQFTKNAIQEHKRNFGHIKFSALRDRIIYVMKWSL